MKKKIVFITLMAVCGFMLFKIQIESTDISHPLEEKVGEIEPVAATLMKAQSPPVISKSVTPIKTGRDHFNPETQRRDDLTSRDTVATEDEVSLKIIALLKDAALESEPLTPKIIRIIEERNEDLQKNLDPEARQKYEEEQASQAAENASFLMRTLGEVMLFAQ